MQSTGVQQAKTQEQIERELMQSVQSAKKAFQQAGVDDLAVARERYVRALDAFNRWLRQKENSAI
jgi:hypothetical protein